MHVPKKKEGNQPILAIVAIFPLHTRRLFVSSVSSPILTIHQFLLYSSIERSDNRANHESRIGEQRQLSKYAARMETKLFARNEEKRGNVEAIKSRSERREWVNGDCVFGWILIGPGGHVGTAYIAFHCAPTITLSVCVCCTELAVKTKTSSTTGSNVARIGEVIHVGEKKRKREGERESRTTDRYFGQHVLLDSCCDSTRTSNAHSRSFSSQLRDVESVERQPMER